ncbi:MAG: MBL fold metallo-hydrolase, partial [Anaerotignaceae bacterium]
MMEFKVQLLGVRGSFPICDNPNFIKYGGATACTLIEFDDQVIILDAGTGLTNLSNFLQEDRKNINLLISHPHLDHLLGFLSYPYLYEKTHSLNIWAKKRGSLDAHGQLQALMSLPLWPVDTSTILADISYNNIDNSFKIGNALIETMESNHPGGITVFKITKNNKTIVYATDCELTMDAYDQLLPFIKDCDLLLCDAQYTSEEYTKTSGWGHSTYDMAINLS